MMGERKYGPETTFNNPRCVGNGDFILVKSWEIVMSVCLVFSNHKQEMLDMWHYIPHATAPFAIFRSQDISTRSISPWWNYSAWGPLSGISTVLLHWWFHIAWVGQCHKLLEAFSQHAALRSYAIYHKRETRYGLVARGSSSIQEKWFPENCQGLHRDKPFFLFYHATLKASFFVSEV